MVFIKIKSFSPYTRVRTYGEGVQTGNKLKCNIMESTVKRRRWSHVPFARARYRGSYNLFARSYAPRAGNIGTRGTNGVTRKAFVGMRKNEILNSLSGEIRAWMAVRIDCENPISARANVTKCFSGRTGDR